MKKGKIATAFQGPELGKTFSNKDHTIVYFYKLYYIGLFLFVCFLKPETKHRSSKEKHPNNNLLPILSQNTVN